MIDSKSDKNKVFFVTGAAGFIGYHLSKSLLEKGCKVIGLDNLNDYYDVSLKKTRLENLSIFESFEFIKGDISEKETVMGIFSKYRPHTVINLAAQAGVRYSLENPDAYIQSNLVGFYNVLEGCRNFPVEHLLYASSSSVYGTNKKVPFEETDMVDNPISLYAATKKSNELMANTYSHLYKIPSTGLRFFTVYGPLGRPDMAYFKFVDSYFSNREIQVFNNGDFNNDLYRDFTYIDDIIQGIELLIEKPPVDEKNTLHKVFNIGNNNPEKLMHFIEILERCLSNSLNREVVFKKSFEPIKPGDVPATYASIDLLQKNIKFKPDTSIENGLQKFTNWYCDYYNLK
ncbi:GDP-mannose 4,6-dehydratase [Jeotgalibacillus proteolyticus]|uniref:NAD-dependent epimerase n=1 Tax=Jeotgalibacillus proteolyticus TaxID=2082395 RepID=A0A2S5G914_9BACL|nr:GDP-mannose 4,6-dehydratase [Jeotgalibacillus proteolyticus]PPA69497.1 NAD-dependent epimerase [Jeotgalibacillus proteolyticus]